MPRVATVADRLTAAERSRIEEELEHLLVSLDDLDAERDAGDLDDADSVSYTHLTLPTKA